MKHLYAQTNVQLFNQMKAQGYSTVDLERVYEAYQFAMQLFTGLFLPSGKALIDHLVGTASVLASLQVRVEIVIAGLMHAAYLHGNYGVPEKGITPSKRNRVAHAVGSAVEEIVERYENMPVEASTIKNLHDNLHRLAPIDKEALLVRLANELDHNLDLGSLYFAVWQDRYRRYIETHGPVMVDIAKMLGFPVLSADLAEVFNSIKSEDPLPEPRMTESRPAAYLIIPNSYRERSWLVFLRYVQRFSKKCRDGAKRSYRKVAKLKGRLLNRIEFRKSRDRLR